MPNFDEKDISAAPQPPSERVAQRSEQAAHNGTVAGSTPAAFTTSDGWHDISTAPKDGTHIIGNTQWGAREIWWHKEGEYWTDEGDSEPEPTGWIPMPGSVPTSLAGQVPDGYVLVPKAAIRWLLAERDEAIAAARTAHITTEGGGENG